jgi:hypothetical protein
MSPKETDMEFKNDLVRETVSSSYRAKFEQEVHETVALGEISWDEANEFIEGFNKKVDSTWGIDFVPKEIGLQVRATVTMEMDVYVTVPFIHCDEDIDEQVKIAIEQAMDGSDDAPSVRDMRVVSAASAEY